MAFNAAGPNRYKGPISTHSLLLEVDVRIAFVSGAWLSVIAIAFAAVEAQFRQVYNDDYESKAVSLFGSNPDLQWLRTLRNEVLHAGAPGGKSNLWKVVSPDLRESHAALEADARRAIEVMFRSNYANRAD